MVAFLNGVWVGTPDSSNVGEAMYLPDSEELLIGFHGGKPNEPMNYYEYAGITFDMAESFALADSKGKWVWDVLRRNGYPYRMTAHVDAHTVPDALTPDEQAWVNSLPSVEKPGQQTKGEYEKLREWRIRLKSSIPHKAAKGFWEETFAASVNPVGEPSTAGRRRIKPPPPAEQPAVTGRTHVPAGTSKPYKPFSTW